MGVDQFELGVFSRAPSTEALLARLQAGGAGQPLANLYAERLAREALLETAHRPLAGEALEAVAHRIQQRSARMQLLTPSGDEIVAGVPWLKGQNTRGQEIYIRTQGSYGLVLVDDLSAPALAQMRRNGAAPAVVTETSPGNYQAWVRVAPGPIGEELATAVARDLAVQYGGDPQSAHVRHFGRLAGFTNRKPSRTMTEGPYRGLQPFVLLREANGRPAPAGPALLARAAERLATEPGSQRQDRSLVRLPSRDIARAVGDEEHLRALYRAQAARLAGRLGDDLSRLDWAVASGLRARGHSLQEVAGAVWVGSPRLAERKAGHVADYVERTVAKVFARPLDRAPPGGDGGTFGR
jgi:hypothetical protein